MKLVERSDSRTVHLPSHFFLLLFSLSLSLGPSCNAYTYRPDQLPTLKTYANFRVYMITLSWTNLSCTTSVWSHSVVWWRQFYKVIKTENGTIQIFVKDNRFCLRLKLSLIMWITFSCSLLKSYRDVYFFNTLKHIIRQKVSD